MVRLQMSPESCLLRHISHRTMKDRLKPLVNPYVSMFLLSKISFSMGSQQKQARRSQHTSPGFNGFCPCLAVRTMAVEFAVPTAFMLSRKVCMAWSVWFMAAASSGVKKPMPFGSVMEYPYAIWFWLRYLRQSRYDCRLWMSLAARSTSLPQGSGTGTSGRTVARAGSALQTYPGLCVDTD